jgi:phospholipase D1/2
VRAAFASRKDKPALVLGATTAMDEKTFAAKPASTSTPKIPSQVRRTVSVASKDPLAPKLIRQDILDGYSRAIAQANHFLYFENQYFRDTAILDAIAKRRKVRKSLQIIMLIPKIIEEADPQRVTEALDPVSKHGAFLQFEMLKNMRTQFKDGLGLFSMERKDGQPVYVHSKVLIVDDVFASIGSANSNPRSYRMDTELDFVWHDPATVKAFRLNLWNEVLGNPKDLTKWKPSEYVKKWQAIATANFNLAADDKKGFLIAFSNILEGEKFPKDISIFT